MTATTFAGWRNEEITLHQRVQCRYTEDGTKWTSHIGNVHRICKNGNIWVETSNGILKCEKRDVRAVKYSNPEVREARRQKDANDFISTIRQQAAESLERYDKELAKLNAEAINAAKDNTMASWLQWGAESVLLATARSRIIAELELKSLVESIGTLSIAELQESLAACEKRLMRWIITQPYSHASSGVMYNFRDECESRARCDIMQNVIKHGLEYTLQYLAERCKEISTEW